VMLAAIPGRDVFKVIMAGDVLRDRPWALGLILRVCAAQKLMILNGVASATGVV